MPRSIAVKKRARFFVALGFVLVCIGALIVWQNLLPTTTDALPSTLSSTDRREIARACRSETVRLSVRTLRSSELKYFARLIPKLMNQRIHRFIADNDGTFRAYVGYPDKNSTDGYGDLWRHQLTKTNGHWQILRSY